MYITPDLFGGAPSQMHSHVYNYTDNNTPSYRTNMTDTQHASIIGKRKRQDAEKASNIYCPHQHQHPPASRTLPRLRTHSTIPSDNNPIPGCSHCATPTIYTASEIRPGKQMKRISPKCTLLKSTSHLMDTESEVPRSFSGPVHPTSLSDLRSCHACRSAPKRKKDLENYLDCRRCDGRTCYICARQCFGACGQAICQKCVVEVGQEGESWCLDCYARSINS